MNRRAGILEIKQGCHHLGDALEYKTEADGYRATLRELVNADCADTDNELIVADLIDALDRNQATSLFTQGPDGAVARLTRDDLASIVDRFRERAAGRSEQFAACRDRINHFSSKARATCRDGVHEVVHGLRTLILPHLKI